jgi:hypothetical protein
LLIRCALEKPVAEAIRFIGSEGSSKCRFTQTLKEQAIHGRVFRNVEDVRTAVMQFKDRHNRHWRLEKLGFLSPLEARQAYAIRKTA